MRSALAQDDSIVAITEGLTRAELRGDVLSAARFRADLGAKLMLRGQVEAAQLHLAASRAVLDAHGRVVDATRVSVLLHQKLWMAVAPGVGTKMAV